METLEVCSVSASAICSVFCADNGIVEEGVTQSGQEVMGRGEDRMSQEVDSRVVEMRFDNANFEKNTKQTISTIDRLMEKLQFKGAEKGFEKLDAAAENVDFATMQTSLDRLESKFSSLNIVATTALVNITNKFVDAGEKLVKSLSIDQVASGWDKYTEKTSNVQTIMNATGKSIDQVNGYLNKLMWYSDETSYSFSEYHLLSDLEF